MRRLITGLALSGAILAMPSGDVANAEVPDKCVYQLYDETLPGVQDPHLVDEINGMAGKGVGVYVQIINSTVPEGVKATQQLVQEYQQRFVQECGFPYDSDTTLDITLDIKGKTYWYDDNGRHIDHSNLKKFEEDLRDESTPYQQDVAELLRTRNTKEKILRWLDEGNNEIYTLIIGGAVVLAGLAMLFRRPKSKRGGDKRGRSNSSSRSSTHTDSIMFMPTTYYGGDSSGGGYSGGDGGSSGGGDGGGSWG